MALSLFKWLLANVLLFSINMPGDIIENPPASKHPVYVSVTEINHNAKDKVLEISCKMFTTDLETTLEKLFNTRVDFSASKDKKVTDKLVADYIQKHLQLKVDDKPVALQFVGSEKEAEATWSYFQVSNVIIVKKIDIMNNLLYEYFEGEINIMHASVNSNRKSTKLNYPDTRTSFEF